MTNEQQDQARSIYRTSDYTMDRRKFRVDIDRAGVARDFQHYIEIGGLVATDIDFYRLRKCFPRGI